MFQVTSLTFVRFQAEQGTIYSFKCGLLVRAVCTVAAVMKTTVSSQLKPLSVTHEDAKVFSYPVDALFSSGH